MKRVAPPPQQFDPITGVWSTPGGVVHDPERADAGAGADEPAVLIGPVPAELADEAPGGRGDATDARLPLRERLRWVLIAVAAGWVGLIVVAVTVSDCLDETGCAPAPAAWLAWTVAIGSVGFGLYAITRLRSNRAAPPPAG